MRDEMGLTNVVVMIPFCRTPEEADRVLDVMADHDLRPGENDLEVYVMAEIPSNILQADDFAERTERGITNIRKRYRHGMLAVPPSCWVQDVRRPGEREGGG